MQQHIPRDSNGVVRHSLWLASVFVSFGSSWSADMLMLPELYSVLRICAVLGRWLDSRFVMQRRHYLMALERSAFEKRGTGYTNKATIIRWPATKLYFHIMALVLKPIAQSRRLHCKAIHTPENAKYWMCECRKWSVGWSVCVIAWHGFCELDMNKSWQSEKCLRVSEWDVVHHVMLHTRGIHLFQYVELHLCSGCWRVPIISLPSSCTSCYVTHYIMSRVQDCSTWTVNAMDGWKWGNALERVWSWLCAQAGQSHRAGDLNVCMLLISQSRGVAIIIASSAPWEKEM